MARRRFYAQPERIDGSIATLSADETHHLMHVLRMTPGDAAFVFDGCGNEYPCSLRGFSDNHAQLEIDGSPLDNIVESSLDLTLAQALAKGEKFDFIIQKATELGVSKIAPLVTRYADVRLDENQTPRRIERWKRISLEALKQCGRRKLVEITAPCTVPAFVGAANRSPIQDSPHVSLLFSERGGVALTEALTEVSKSSQLTALIGPEGGWSDDELEILNESGCRSVTLGPRVLRTETAAIAALTLIQHALGDLTAEFEMR
jgi:16S rRNA (uracil1498-N3)-methyltransferase